MPPPKPHGVKAPPTDYKTIAEQYARAKRTKEIEDADRAHKNIHAEKEASNTLERQREALEKGRKQSYEQRWWWTVAFWVWLLCIHGAGILLFTNGFLLTRLVLEEKSNCTAPPAQSTLQWEGQGTIEGGCWHPKSFDKAVIILIDALRYDFTVPLEDKSQAHHFHNAFPFLYETALSSPSNAFLRPFIADPPTSTLQRLKGLTTGTLPTFMDLGSSFSGTAIDEDNLLMQLKSMQRRVVQLGDDTWWSLFPGYFEPNISRAYDSFNVWDLHTVDNGVMEHIFPLMRQESKGSWDVLIGHLLGVDHAGHRYGPDHTAMNDKLQQMDRFIRALTELVDEDTVLVVMGDHGMDSKGDHGGESDDEVEAALWMYSKRPFFGRTKAEYVTPPRTAKIRPVNQIDLVPTLALLLGIPIPYNNLGKPIEEAFASKDGTAWDNLAAVARITTAGIQTYQSSYFAARGIEPSTVSKLAAELRTRAEGLFGEANNWQGAYEGFTVFQEETLSICKDLWARFDVPKMVVGIIIAATGVFALVLYASRTDDDDLAILENLELDIAEKNLEIRGIKADTTKSYQTVDKSLVIAAVIGAIPGAAAGAGLPFLSGLAEDLGDLPYVVAGAAFGSTIAVIISLLGLGKTIMGVVPDTFWGWLAVVFTVAQSAGFASNSYTIWEDSILLFFTTTFGLASAIASFQIPSAKERTLAVYHSIMFAILGRLASFSKLCREEQMPYCTSTYYASASSSTSAPWQLIIPFAVFLMLPPIIKSFLTPTKSYEGLAPTWIGYVFRTGLFMSALFWVMDTADNGNWFPNLLSAEAAKSLRVYVAQLVIALAFVAGSTAFVWAPPNVSISTVATASGRAQVRVLGYGNANGSRFLLLPINILGGCILLSKPMGGGALAIMFWQVLSLIEILDLNGLTAESIGPVMLGVLGNFHYFKTGHQATLSSLQWDSAFIPLFTIRYPWSPLVMVLNTFAGQVVAATCVPLVVLWKVGPRRRGILESVGRALGVFIAYFAVEALATMAWAGWLRRHLMLYRVFNPRFMMGAALLLTVDLVGILVALTGLRSNTMAVSEVFGWVD
jgi:GPI ethanolamine phosphate transferase 3 subunit O